MKLVAMLAVCALFTGCATSTPTVGMDGQAANMITCPGDQPSRCYTKAVEVCPEGYSIQNETNGGVLGKTMMLIRCKKK